MTGTTGEALTTTETIFLAGVLTQQDVPGVRPETVKMLQMGQVTSSMPDEEARRRPGESSFRETGPTVNEFAPFSSVYRVSEELVDGWAWLFQAEAHCPNVPDAKVTVSREASTAIGGGAELKVGFFSASGEKELSITDGLKTELLHCGAVMTRRRALLWKRGYAYGPGQEADFYVYDFDSWAGEDAEITETIAINDCLCRTGEQVGQAQVIKSTDQYIVPPGTTQTPSHSQEQTLTLSVGLEVGLPGKKDSNSLKLSGKHTRSLKTEVENPLPGGHTYTASTLDSGTVVWSVGPSVK